MTSRRRKAPSRSSRCEPAANRDFRSVACSTAVVNNHEVGVVQGYLEQSNVNGISQMTQLIQVNRAFESISSLMRDTESTFGDAIKTLGGAR